MVSGRRLVWTRGKKLVPVNQFWTATTSTMQNSSWIYYIYCIILLYDGLMFLVFSCLTKKPSIPSHPPVVPPLPGRRWCPDGGDGGLAWDERGATSNRALAAWRFPASHRGTPSHHPCSIAMPNFTGGYMEGYWRFPKIWLPLVII